MATQQEVIKKFMASLDKTSLQGTEAIDEAIRACSNFQSAQDVINNMISDRTGAGSGDSFLRNYCGIILGNSDTGAITGSDAGSGVTKTGTSVVPNGTFNTSFNDTSFTTTNGVTFQLAYVDDEGYRYPLYDFNYLSDSEKHIWQGLKSFWAEESLKLIEESYGYSLTDSDSQYRNIRVYFIDDPNRATAWTGSDIFGTDDEKRIYMNINMHYFNSDYVNPNDLDGKCSYWGGTYYLDRLIAHEFTHAVMNAKVNNFSELPAIIVEGLAELTSGMDDEQYNNIKTAVSGEDMMKKLLVLQEDYNEVDGINNEDYVAGYIFLRYLAYQAADLAPTDGDDQIENTSEGVEINALAGNDTINNRASQVTINADAGNDRVTNFSAEVTINGGAGADFLFNSGNGKNVLINGGNDSDTILNYGSDVTITGGAGNDSINNDEGENVLFQFRAGDGNDLIEGFNESSTLKIGNGTGTYSQETVNNDLILTVGTEKISLVGAANLSTVNILGTKIPVEITNYNNSSLVAGTSYTDKIFNHANYVTIRAFGNNDTIINYGSDPAAVNSSNGRYALIQAGDGNDSVENHGMYVTIDGGAGADIIGNSSWGIKASLNGGAGNDYLWNHANATIQGGDGDDTVYNSNLGADAFIELGNGNDSVGNWGGNVTIRGGNGKDTLYNDCNIKNILADGGADDDKIYNFADNSTLLGGAGNDSIENYGVIYRNGVLESENVGKNVTINGGAGDDYIFNNAANVLFQYFSGDGNDKISGFNETSTLSIGGGNYSSTKSGSDMIFTVGTGKITLDGAASLSKLNIVSSSPTTYSSSTIKGSSQNDIIKGSAGNDSITGEAGADSIFGDAGNDKLLGNNGKDSLWGGAGNDTLTGGNGKDFFIYSEGNDVITDYAVTEKISLGANISDTALNGLDVILTTDAGTLTIKKAKGKNLNLINPAGKSFSTMVGVLTNFTVTNLTKSPVTVGSAIKTVTAASRTKAAKISGNALDNTMTGGKGNDTLLGGAGDDSIFGNTGNDTIRGGVGNDTLLGGKGNDMLWGNKGSDVFIYESGDGQDVIFGFENSDMLQITGNFSTSLNSAKTEIYFAVDSTSDAITLKNFTATTFNINGTNYKISGADLIRN